MISQTDRQTSRDQALTVPGVLLMQPDLLSPNHPHPLKDSLL